MPQKPVVILLKAPWCPICPRADQLYQHLLHSKEADFEYRPLTVESGEGLKLVKKHDIYAIPTTLINGEVVFKGVVPTPAQVLAELQKRT